MRSASDPSIFRGVPVLAFSGPDLGIAQQDNYVLSTHMASRNFIEFESGAIRTTK